MPRDNRLSQGVDQRRLANARVPRNGCQRRLASCRHALEDSEQPLELPVASIQFVRDQEALRDILRAERERLDPARGLPLRETPVEIGAQSIPALVAVFR